MKTHILKWNCAHLSPQSHEALILGDCCVYHGGNKTNVLHLGDAPINLNSMICVCRWFGRHWLIWGLFQPADLLGGSGRKQRITMMDACIRIGDSQRASAPRSPHTAGDASNSAEATIKPRSRVCSRGRGMWHSVQDLHGGLEHIVMSRLWHSLPEQAITLVFVDLKPQTFDPFGDTNVIYLALSRNQHICPNLTLTVDI